MLFELNCGQKKFLFINVYMPYCCYDNLPDFMYYLGKISSIISDADTPYIFVIGDLMPMSLLQIICLVDPGGALGPKKNGCARGAFAIWTQIECKIPIFYPKVSAKNEFCRGKKSLLNQHLNYCQVSFACYS